MSTLKTKQYLALDLATTTGWALASTDGRIIKVHRGIWNFPKGTQPGARYHGLQRKLRQLQVHYGHVSAMYVERPGYTRSLDAAKVQNGLWAVAALFAFDLGWKFQGGSIPFHEVSPKEWKAWAGLHVNGKKPATVAKIHEWGYPVRDDNEADAIAILAYGCQNHGLELRGDQR